MILERVPGKNLQEKRFQKLTQVSLTPGEEDVERRRRRKNGKKKQRNYPRGQTRIGVVQKRGNRPGGKNRRVFFFLSLPLPDDDDDDTV